MSKEYRIVLSYDVQKLFLVKAKNEEEAFSKAYKNWQGDTKKYDWKNRYNIESV